MYQCIADRAPGGKSCGGFYWAKFDEDGLPEWAEGFKGDANGPIKALEGRADTRVAEDEGKVEDTET
jgi:hypothetical protein